MVPLKGLGSWIHLIEEGNVFSSCGPYSRFPIPLSVFAHTPCVGCPMGGSSRQLRLFPIGGIALLSYKHIFVLVCFQTITPSRESQLERA